MVIDTSKVETRGIIIDATFRNGMSSEVRQFLTDCTPEEMLILCAYLLRAFGEVERNNRSINAVIANINGENDDL
jgi:hypothetical protein